MTTELVDYTHWKKNHVLRFTSHFGLCFARDKSDFNAYKQAVSTCLHHTLPVCRKARGLCISHDTKQECDAALFWKGMSGTFLQPFLPARIAVSRDLLQNYNYDDNGHVIFFTIS
jgi:hypothetical protein